MSNAASESPYCDAVRECVVYELTPRDDGDPAVFRSFWQDYLDFIDKGTRLSPPAISDAWAVYAAAVAKQTPMIERFGYDKGRCEEQATLEEKALFESPGPEAEQALQADGRWVATGGTSGTVRLFDLASGSPGAELSVGEAWVVDLAFNPRTGELAVAVDNNLLRFYDPRTHRRVGSPVESVDSPFLGMAFSPDGRRRRPVRLRASSGSGPPPPTPSSDRTSRATPAPSPASPTAPTAGCAHRRRGLRHYPAPGRAERGPSGSRAHRRLHADHRPAFFLDQFLSSRPAFSPDGDGMSDIPSGAVFRVGRTERNRSSRTKTSW